MFVNKFDVEFSTNIYVLRSPEPKEVVSKMPFCTYILYVYCILLLCEPTASTKAVETDYVKIFTKPVLKARVDAQKCF